jgi:hypothetical protein
MRRGVMEQMVSLISLGDGSTLTLDFTTGVLDSRLTFTRASTTATYINSSGYITTAGTNVPRFDYDPTTLAPRGLLVEGQATNLMFRSQEIATSPWFNAGTMTVSNIGSGSPANDATSNVVTWTNGTGSGGAWLQQNVAVSAGALVVGTAYTWSVWLKNRGGRRVNLFAVLQGVTGNREVRVDFGVSPPTVTSTVATGWTSIQTPTIVEYPNGWYKITTGGTLPASVTSVNFGFSNADAVPASGTNGFEAWGYQLETGSGASSYIPTGASQATRALDSCYIAGTNFTSWFSAGAGTVVAQSDNVCIPAVGSQNLVGNFSDSTSSNYVRMGYQVGGGTTELLLTSVGGSIQGASDSGFTPTLNTTYKSAYAWDTNNFACCANGGAVGTDVSGTLAGAGVITSLTIGGDFYQTSGPNSIYMKNGHIRLFKYWPTRLPNAQLQSLTT